MPSLPEIRQQYPQYDDLSDEQLASSLHKQFYSDMPDREFRKTIGAPLNHNIDWGKSVPDVRSAIAKLSPEDHDDAIKQWAEKRVSADR